MITLLQVEWPSVKNAVTKDRLFTGVALALVNIVLGKAGTKRQKKLPKEKK